MTTHVNAYRQDVEDAYNKAQQALGSYKDCVDALLARLEEDHPQGDNPPDGTVPTSNGPRTAEHSK